MSAELTIIQNNNVKFHRMKHYTRFRAYQLGECGASFSLSVDKTFTLIEARLTETNAPHIVWEMNNLGIDHISTLHITSWDADHCKSTELQAILKCLKPERIEYPSYSPHTDNGKESLKLINAYQGEKVPITVYRVSLNVKTPLRGEDLYYNPLKIVDKSNDNSVVKLFRVGSFQVLSLGDCESSDISETLSADEILKEEVDLLILAHHGADNGFTTTNFLKALSPSVAICASDYGNKYGHPDAVIISRLRNAGIDYYSTKTGDIIAQTVDTKHFKVSNYIANNEEKDSVKTYPTKTWYISDLDGG